MAILLRYAMTYILFFSCFWQVVPLDASRNSAERVDKSTGLALVLVNIDRLAAIRLDYCQCYHFKSYKSISPAEMFWSWLVFFSLTIFPPKIT